MYFNVFLVIWLFFLKTGSIITIIKSVWSPNQQQLVHWVTLLHIKSLSTVGWLTLHIKANECKKKPNIARKLVFEVSGCVWLSLKLNWKKKSYRCWYHFFFWQIPVHRFVYRALVMQIARVMFSGVPFCHGWIQLPFLKGVGGRGAVRWWFSVH